MLYHCNKLGFNITKLLDTTFRDAIPRKLVFKTCRKKLKKAEFVSLLNKMTAIKADDRNGSLGLFHFYYGRKNG